MVVICIWCVLFVTSQFDVIFMFTNQRFGEVCCHNRHFLLHALPYFMCHCTEYKISALLFRISEENLLNAITQQFITAKISGCVLGGFLTPTPPLRTPLGEPIYCHGPHGSWNIAGGAQKFINFILKFYVYLPRKKLCQGFRETCLDLSVYVSACPGVSF